METKSRPFFAWDLLTVAQLVRPELFTTSELECDVIVEGASQGRIVRTAGKGVCVLGWLVTIRTGTTYDRSSALHYYIQYGTAVVVVFRKPSQARKKRLFILHGCCCCCCNLFYSYFFLCYQRKGVLSLHLSLSPGRDDDNQP